ncbi:hypothetical protein ACWKWF_03460 [Acinetobacter kookii]
MMLSFLLIDTRGFNGLKQQVQGAERRSAQTEIMDKVIYRLRK